MKNNMLEWSHVNEFLREYELLTPYGKMFKKELKLIKDLRELSHQYDLNQILIDFFKDIDEEIFASLCYSISRIPFIESLKVVNSSDVFLFKRFFYNLKKIIHIIGNKISSAFNIYWEFEDIYEILKKGGGDIESFHISSSYSENLSDIRKDLSIIDNKIKTKRKDFFSELIKEFSVDFNYRDFIIIPYSKVDKIKDREEFYIETYDSENFLVKPVFPAEIFDLLREKDRLLKVESTEENIILDKISSEIFKLGKKILNSINSIKLLDIVFSRVTLMKRYNMYKRPQFNKEGIINIQNGEYIPLKEKCLKKNIQYYPLDIKLENNIGIIRGSNMGGKTIVIKSIAFFQILAQYGFFIPCDRFESEIFDEILTLSEIVEVELSGLSSFGTEITNLINVLEKRGNILLLIDEFGRTTNSDEAFAMLCGLIEYFIQNPRFKAVFSTHFLKLPEFCNISCFRMKGLDHERFIKEYKNKDNDKDKVSIKKRLELINGFMEYIIEKDNNQRQSKDALNVADILGLDQKIIEYAGNYMGRQNEK